jgi:hypothetical protein
VRPRCQRCTACGSDLHGKSANLARSGCSAPSPENETAGDTQIHASRVRSEIAIAANRVASHAQSAARALPPKFRAARSRRSAGAARAARCPQDPAGCVPRDNRQTHRARKSRAAARRRLGPASKPRASPRSRNSPGAARAVRASTPAGQAHRRASRSRRGQRIGRVGQRQAATPEWREHLEWRIGLASRFPKARAAVHCYGSRRASLPRAVPFLLRRSSSARGPWACFKSSNSGCSASRRTSSIRCASRRPVHRAVSGQADLRHSGAARLRRAGIDRSAAGAGEAVPRHVPSRQEVTEVRCQADGKIHVATSAGTRLIAGAVVIAAGVGSFQPRRSRSPDRGFEGKSVHYRVKSAADFHGRDLVICGGGDSALDWTVALCEKARSLTLVHRRAEFRAAPATVARMRELVARARCSFIEGNSWLAQPGTARARRDPRERRAATCNLPQIRFSRSTGLHPKLGPIAEWGLELEKKALKVDTEKFQTSVPGHLRDRRHQHLSRQEEADFERLSTRRRSRRSASSIICSRRSGNSCSTRPPARSCRSAWAWPAPEH